MSRPFCAAHGHTPVGVGRALLVTGLIVFAVPATVAAQVADRWSSTADDYDAAGAAAFVDHLGRQLEARHGSLADELFALNAGLSRTPHNVESRPRGPYVAPLEYVISGPHLVHYQADEGGTLGQLHGATAHPVGLDWLPHSMFAQSGRVFGQWGHARLLAGVSEFVERHSG